MRKYIGSFWQVLLAWIILFGLFVLVGILSQIGIKIWSIINPLGFWSLLTIGAHTFSGYITVVLLLLFSISPMIFFIIWIVKDSRKFKVQGINTKPYLWGLGVALPTVIVIFPVYLVYRNIIWNNKLNLENVITSSYKDFSSAPKNMSSNRKALYILLGLLAIFIYTPSMLNAIALKHKPFAKFLVNFNLEYFSCPSSNKSDCEELVTLPKGLQGKKIVFAQDTNIKFDPHEGHIKNNSIDTEGYLDIEHGKFSTDFIDPVLQKRGNLEDREYKIIRAMYSYRCSYCFDGDNLGYIVIEDSKGHRFISLLDKYDISVNPVRDLSWDEYLPYYLGKDKDGKEMLYARLEDI